MEAWIYRNERSLGAITLVLGLLGWFVLLLITFGVLLLYILFGFIFYVFAQSAMIAWIKGTAVKLSPNQLPELYERFQFCCQKLGMTQMPEAYVLHGNGFFNAFATRFLGRNFVVLLSDVVDALEEQPDGINFYMGHELGHIRRGHLTGHLWRLPALWLPLLGAAYSRAKEYTCDLHGRACCADGETASRALAALGAGAKQWRHMNLADYAGQNQGNAGFWGSFHELIGSYPWLTKRVARMINPDAEPPARNPFAYVLAAFLPYGGRMFGGAGGLIILILIFYILGILAAVALPAFQDYKGSAQAFTAWEQAASVRTALSEYYANRQKVPKTLAEAGAATSLPGGGKLTLNTKTMVVSIKLPQGVLEMVPEADEDDAVTWHCEAGEGLRASMLPKSCKQE